SALRGGKSGHQRAGWSLTGTGGNPKESATENTPSHTASSGNGIRVKWRGKSSPVPWRHGSLANPIRCKAKKGASRNGSEDCPSFNPGRPHEVPGNWDP